MPLTKVAVYELNELYFLILSIFKLLSCQILVKIDVLFLSLTYSYYLTIQ